MDDDLRTRISALHASIDSLDYYEILDVEPDAGHDDIRDAFYRLASDMHPDQHVGAPSDQREKALAIFKRANEAYGTLTNPGRRRRYDEGLARGEKRLGPERPTASHAPKDPATTIQTPLARQFCQMARQALDKGNLQGAKLNLTIALNHEGPNAFLEGKLREVQEKMRGGKQ